MSSSHPRVAVLAFPGISLFHLSVPDLLFGEDWSRLGLPRLHYQVCAEQPGLLPTANGLPVQVAHDLAVLAEAELIIIPSWGDPAIPASPVLVAALQQAAQRGARMVGLCLGAFVLGDAGLLDGRDVTTHWGWCAQLAGRFPQARVHADVLYLDDGAVMTSAGTVAAIDGCLHLLRQQQGVQAANRVARRLVMPPQRQGGQAQYIEQPVPVRAGDERIAATLDWARERLDSPLDVDQLAARALMSRRTFQRRFVDATGQTVQQWLAQERVRLACQLLEGGDWPVERVAQAVGFATALSLRQHFQRHLGITPAAWRKLYRPVSLRDEG
ncbi:GlxA family transcriptional regulator [Leeia aquatica]|uniref:Helix-turn-helix domain-containing protein n=1 Tax=Leeia aquatica TaxID=2725557 RepID=A0A847S6E6_9NEIS|nr:helix-turn-helix domain-containing protein [Leeia aquatica]NLR74385.1 helix-turn-helix domain-containing protein [Leeia aquatica]